MQQYETSYSPLRNLRTLVDMRTSRARSKVKSIEQDRDQNQSVESLLNDWNVQKLRSHSSTKQIQNLSLSMIEVRQNIPVAQQSFEIIEELPEMQHLHEPYTLVSQRPQKNLAKHSDVLNFHLKNNKKVSRKTINPAPYLKQSKKINQPLVNKVKTQTSMNTSMSNSYHQQQQSGKENLDKSLSRSSFRLEKRSNSISQQDDVIQVVKRAKQQSKLLLEQKGQYSKMEEINKYFAAILNILK